MRAWHPINGVALLDASPKRPVAAEARVSTPLFGGLSFPLPAELAIEAMVQIHAGIVVGLRFIVANEAAEELASFVRDALTCAPHSGSTSAMFARD
jgi:hypothetical protein